MCMFYLLCYGALNALKQLQRKVIKYPQRSAYYTKQALSIIDLFAALKYFDKSFNKEKNEYRKWFKSVDVSKYI